MRRGSLFTSVTTPTTSTSLEQSPLHTLDKGVTILGEYRPTVSRFSSLRRVSLVAVNCSPHSLDRVSDACK
jgi:hypothetical protein